jgi:hypothetical protein
MQVKKGNVTLTVANTKKTSDLIIGVSIAFPGIADCCLKQLNTKQTTAHMLMNGSEEGAFVYAIFESIRDKLAGSALEIFKTKVSGIKCNSIDGHFTIIWETQGTGTSLRKTVGLALSCLNTIKLFAKYNENIRFLSGKGGNREEFNFLVKKFTEGVKKGVCVTAIGKINTDMSKLKDIVNVLDSKLPKQETAPAGETKVIAKKSMTSKGDKDSGLVVEIKKFPSIKCSGLSAVIVADYIRNNSGGMSVEVNDDGVTIFNSSWSVKEKQLREVRRIKDYIEKKYSRLEDNGELSPLFGYYALSEGFANAVTAERIVVSKLKTEKLIELLKKTI